MLVHLGLDFYRFLVLKMRLANSFFGELKYLISNLWAIVFLISCVISRFWPTNNVSNGNELLFWTNGMLDFDSLIFHQLILV